LVLTVGKASAAKFQVYVFRNSAMLALTFLPLHGEKTVFPPYGE
jgi:hypothetical protein